MLEIVYCKKKHERLQGGKDDLHGAQLDAYAKSIGWFDSNTGESSDYTGEGKPNERKAPSAPSREYHIGDIEVGMDGREWISTKTRKGTRWMRAD